MLLATIQILGHRRCKVAQAKTPAFSVALATINSTFTPTFKQSHVHFWHAVFKIARLKPEFISISRIFPIMIFLAVVLTTPTSVSLALAC